MKLEETVTHGRLKAADYGESLKTNPVENYPEYLKWVGKMLKNPDRCDRILGDNRKRFKEMLGKPSFVFQGEFKHDCWLEGLPGGVYVLVLTAKTKGTCYEIVTEMDGEKQKIDAKKVLEFMDMIGGT